MKDVILLCQCSSAVSLRPLCQDTTNHQGLGLGKSLATQKMMAAPESRTSNMPSPGPGYSLRVVGSLGFLQGTDLAACSGGWVANEHRPCVDAPERLLSSVLLLCCAMLHSALGPPVASNASKARSPVVANPRNFKASL